MSRVAKKRKSRANNETVLETQFRFKKGDHIGTSGAEEDIEYLEGAFVDTGELDTLLDVADHRQIVLGRTGSGKSALLSILCAHKEDHAIVISPENLALTYVSNSTVLNFFSQLGVNLDPFFKLLWRHVFTVEVLRSHFEADVSEERSSFTDWLKKQFAKERRKQKEMQEVIQYLENWGKSFWKETEYRVQEVTRKIEGGLEAQVESSLGIKAANLAGNTKAAYRLSEEQRVDLIQRGQNVVSTAQIEGLHKAIQLLDSVLSDRQKAFYIVIDDLDQNWVEERL